MSKIELQAFVSGRVQGVGFRAILRRYAIQYGLTGFARNLEDGRVEFLIQGPKLRIEEFLKAVKSNPGIQQIEESWQEPTQLFPSFEIIG